MIFLREEINPPYLLNILLQSNNQQEQKRPKLKTCKDTEIKNKKTKFKKKKKKLKLSLPFDCNHQQLEIFIFGEIHGFYPSRIAAVISSTLATEIRRGEPARIDEEIHRISSRRVTEILPRSEPPTLRHRSEPPPRFILHLTSSLFRRREKKNKDKTVRLLFSLKTNGVSRLATRPKDPVLPALN